MNDILNKIKELTAQCEALQDPKTIELIIKAQIQNIKEDFNTLLNERQNFMEALSQVETQMIQEYCTKRNK